MENSSHRSWVSSFPALAVAAAVLSVLLLLWALATPNGGRVELSAGTLVLIGGLALALVFAAIPLCRRTAVVMKTLLDETSSRLRRASEELEREVLRRKRAELVAAELAARVVGIRPPAEEGLQAVAIAEVAARVGERVRAEVAPSRIDVRVEAAEGLPLLVADPAELEQALFDLAAKARQSMGPSGAGVLVIKAGPGPGGRDILVTAGPSGTAPVAGLTLPALEPGPPGS